MDVKTGLGWTGLGWAGLFRQLQKAFRNYQSAKGNCGKRAKHLQVTKN